MTSLQAAAETDALRGDALPVGLPERPSAEFEAIYREYFRFVWRSVRRLGMDGFVVDDVVQDTFLVVHRRLGAFEGRSSTKTWLYGIVRRVVADYRRTQRRKPGLEGHAAPSLDFVPDDPAKDPEARTEQAEQVRLVRRLLAELDDDKREAFVLAEFEGMTMAEIAEALDVNPNTISSRLRAARREFEEALERATQDDDSKGTTTARRAR